MKKYLVLSAIVLGATPVVALAANPACLAISRYLSVGSRGQEVVHLQNFLISQKLLAAGLSTGYFGPLTEAAVGRFQNMQGIVSGGTPATTGFGAVGPRTRAALSQCSIPATPHTPSLPILPTTPTPPPAQPPVSASPAPLPETSSMYASIAANQKSMTLAAFKFHPDLEAVNLNQVGLTVTSGSAGDLDKVTLWARTKNINGVRTVDPSGELTQIGATLPAGSFPSMIAVLSPTVQLPKNQDSTIWIAGDIAPIGVGYTANSGDLIKIDLDTTNTKGNGKDSGQTVFVSGSPTVPGKRIFKSVPTFTYSTASGVASNGANDLLFLTISADPKGDVTLAKLTFVVSLTGATASSFTFSGPSGAVHSASTLSLFGSTVVAPFDSISNVRDATISAGTSKTYILRVQNLSFTNNAGAITASLKADASFSGMSTQAALSGSNLIWSPDSTESPASPSASDWANGYGLPGCFATAGLGFDCPACTLAK